MTHQQDNRYPEERQAGAEPLLLPHTEGTRPTLPAVTTAEIATLLEFSPDALILVDSQGSMVLVNQLAASLFGYHPEELVSHPLEMLLPRRFHTAHRAHRAHYATAPSSRPMGVGLDLVGLRKDGSEFPVDISLRPVHLSQAIHVLAAIRDVSAQRLLERERARQAERLSQQATLINLAHDAILTRDPISRILSWNRGAEELYGWTEQEALGRVTHTLLKTRFPTNQAEVERQLEQQGQWEGELTHIRRDGRLVVVESHQILVRDDQGTPTAILEINRDRTERRKLEQEQATAHRETRRERVFLQELLDALPSGVYVVHGREARLVLANRAAARIWGAEWQPSQPMRAFLEEQHIQILDNQGRAFPSEAWATTRALLQGETVLQHQEIIRQPSGANLPVLVNAVPLASSHWHALEVQDEAGRDEHQSDGEPLALVIHQDVRLLKEAEYFKDEFIGIAAHELRLPLAVLKGAVGTLVLQTARGHGTPLSDWQQEMLQELDQATDRLTELTEDLLDVSRLQAGQLLLQRTPTNLVSLLHRVAQRLQKTTTRHHLEVKTELAPLEVLLDPRRMEQVLSNLLTNAIKYSPQGGSVEVELKRQEGAQMLELRVRDHGMGIPQHQQGRIFGRFVRADNAQAAGISGTGLGLYLSRALVEQHGGQVWFTSTEGEGTTFGVRLPLQGHENRE